MRNGQVTPRALTATAPICYLVGESLDGFLSSFSTDVLTTIIKKNCKQDKINIFYANEAQSNSSSKLLIIIMVQYYYDKPLRE